MNKPVARDWVGSALHIYRQAGVPELSRWFFIVAVGNSSAIGSVAPVRCETNRLRRPADGSNLVGELFPEHQGWHGKKGAAGCRGRRGRQRKGQGDQGCKKPLRYLPGLPVVPR